MKWIDVTQYLKNLQNGNACLTELFCFQVQTEGRGDAEPAIGR
jgi:hypothetical protein